MAIMKTLTVGTETYTVRDPEAVSFEQPQALSAVRQQTARGNIGAVSAKEVVDQLCPGFTESGAAISCRPVEGHPLEVVSSIVPVQSGTGDPSPDNIRPITGHSAVKLTRCGKNLFGGELLADRMAALGAVKDATAGTVTYSPGSCNTNDPIFDKFKENTQYTLILYGRNTITDRKNYMNLDILYTDGSHENVSGVEYNTDETIVRVTSATRTVKAIKILYSSGNSLLHYNQCGIFEGVIGADDFEPYNGDTVTLDLGQEVYGGSLDWATGVLTVTDRHLNLNTTTAPTIVAYTFNGMNGIQFQYVLDTTGYKEGPGMCSHARVGKVYAPNGMWIGASSGLSRTIYWIGVMDYLGLSTVDEFKAWLDTQNVQVCYKLLSPITVQLTPQEITALSGVNTLYSDTGDTQVSGKADPRTIIEKLTNAILSLGGNV